jgi:signal transduction histidine kinase
MVGTRLPYQSMAFYHVGSDLAEQITVAIGLSEGIDTFESIDELLNFIWDETNNNEIGSWRIVFLDWNFLVKTKSLPELSEVIHTDTNVNYVFLFDSCPNKDEAQIISELDGGSNVHFVPREDETLTLLKDCVHSIQHDAKLHWLLSRNQIIAGLIDSYATKDITSQEVLGGFLAEVRHQIGAESVGIFYVSGDGKFESLYKKSEISDFRVKLAECELLRIKFVEGGQTYSDQVLVRKLFPTLDKTLTESIIFTASVFGDEPVIVVYLFQDKCFNQSDIPFLRLLCNGVSRELIHFLYLRNLERLKNVIEKLSMSLNWDTHEGLLDRDDIREFEALAELLKTYFYAEGVAFLIFEKDDSGEDVFRSISFERARRDKYPIPASKPSFVNYSYFQNKALIIDKVLKDSEPPVGVGFAFDVFDLHAGKGTPVKLETFRREGHIEDEEYLMYYPIKLSAIQMVVKLSNFGSHNSFSLAQLKFLELASSLIGTTVFNLENLRKILGKLEDKELHQQIVNKAEQLYFYREISLSVLHQLKNYLNTINSSMLLIEMDADGLQGRTKQELVETIGKVDKNLKNASKILHRAFERGSKLSPEIKRYELVEDILRNDFLPELEKRAETEKIIVEKALTNSKYYVEVDAELLRESLLNIVDNALYAIKQNRTSKKRIFIGLAKSDDNQYVRISIEDSGIGIPKEYAKQVFNPLFSTKGQGGTGWGLFFAQKMIVEHFLGKISIADSRIGKGTTFLIELPLS